MKKRFAKFLSIFLVIVMVAGALPVRQVVLADTDETVAETEAQKDESDSEKTPESKPASDKEQEKEKEDKTPAPASEPDETNETSKPDTGAGDDKNSDAGETAEPEPSETEATAEVPETKANTPAKNDGTVITSVSATVTAPSVGATASFKASIPSGVGYYIDEETGYAHEGYNKTVFWYDLSTGAAVEENGVFKAGHQYEVYVYLTAKEGYTFDFSNMKATLNGKTAGTARMAFDRIRIDYDFDTLPGTVSDIINSVEVTLDAPEVGKAPDYDAVFPSGAKYYSDAHTGGSIKNDIYWLDATSQSYVSPTGLFTAGRQYKVFVYLTARDGYTFNQSSITAKMNGYAAECEMDGDQLVVTYTFPKLATNTANKITSVAITLDAPSNGATPDYTASLPSGATYSAYSVIWKDASTETAISGTFVGGHQYKVEVYLNPNTGYYFDYTTTAKLNNMSVLCTMDGSRLKVYYTFQALQATAISSASITLDAPSAGGTPDYTATFPSGATYTSTSNNSGNYRNGIRWYDVTSSAEVNATSGKFQAGHQYRVEAYLTANDGYAFSSSTTAKVNNAAATVALDNGQLKVTYTFSALSKVAISSVAITLDAPSNGGTPDYTATFPSGATYASASNNSGNYRNGIRWYDVTSSAEVNATSGKFQAGHQYRVEAYLTANDGYAFSSSTTAKVNNAAATVALDNGQLKVTYTFSALSKVAISSVAITLDAPSNGGTPDYTATFPSGATYASASNNSGNYRNGIRWYDVTSSAEVNATSGKFQAGHQYRVEAYLAANDGYTFSSSTTAKVNNATATAALDNGQLKVTYIFTALAKVAISSVSITLDAPSSGASPDYTAVFPSGATYSSATTNSGNYLNGIRWYDVTSSAEVNSSSGKFQAGHQYRVEAYLTAKDGYTFNSSTTAKVNNATATVALDNGQLKVTYTFAALAKIAITAAAITVDAPSIGAAPDYTATLTSGVNYVSSSNNSGNYRNGIKWFDVTANADVNPTSGTFQPGHQYRVEAYLTAKDGYTFTASTTAKVNNAAATAAFDNNQLCVTYTFTALPVPTVYANIYCYNETDGQKITDGNVYVAKNNGTQLPAGANQIKISANSNESFTLTAGVTGGGYEFSGWYSGEYGSSSAALVSRNATITVKITADTSYFAAFKKYTMINSLTFAADKAPAVGKTVQQCMPSVTVAEAGVTVSSVTLKNTSGTQLASTHSFSKGEQVVLSVVYSINSTYKLAGDIKDHTTLNGNKPSSHDTSKNTLTYVFTASGYININGIEVTGIADKTYTGEAITQAPVVTYNGKTLTEGTDYKIGYANNVEAGTATVVISGTGNYGGAKTVTFEILQASNTVTVKGKTVKVKYKKLRKKAQAISTSKVLTITNPKGTLTYSLVTVKRGKSKKYKKYFKVNAANGIVTVKKKLRKGKYKVTVKVMASGDENYKGATKSVTFTVKVK